MRIAGPEIFIPRNEAVLLSLLFNELATNATKYGAWSGPDGSVSIVWKLITVNDADMIEMTWTERGGPAVDVPSRKGFGTNVMKFAIERGLSGEIVPSYKPEGFECIVRVPRLTSNPLIDDAAEVPTALTHAAS